MLSPKGERTLRSVMLTVSIFGMMLVLLPLLSGCGSDESPTGPALLSSAGDITPATDLRAAQATTLGKSSGSKKRSGSGSGSGGSSSGGQTSTDASQFSNSLESFLQQLGISWTENGTESALTVTRRITAANGGVVWAGRYSVVIPPGALSQDTDISIVQRWDAGQAVGFDLLPHGTQFNSPVTLSVWLGDKGLLATDDVRQLWYDDASGTWVDMGGVWSSPTLSTQITHFSRWVAGRAGW